ncbi:hypothetical protein AHAS_Ahas02G0064000 [Arachis hypogaea]
MISTATIRIALSSSQRVCLPRFLVCFELPPPLYRRASADRVLSPPAGTDRLRALSLSLSRSTSLFELSLAVAASSLLALGRRR